MSFIDFLFVAVSRKQGNSCSCFFLFFLIFFFYYYYYIFLCLTGLKTLEKLVVSGSLDVPVFRGSNSCTSILLQSRRAVAWANLSNRPNSSYHAQRENGSLANKAALVRVLAYELPPHTRSECLVR